MTNFEVRETTGDQNCITVADGSLSFNSVIPALEPDADRGDDGRERSDGEASAPLYRLSEDYVAEVTLRTSEMQTYTVTVKLAVTMSLFLNIGENDTVWSNVCYFGSWGYSPTVTIDDDAWGPNCPWDDAEKARQKKLVEDSIYIISDRL